MNITLYEFLGNLSEKDLKNLWNKYCHLTNNRDDMVYNLNETNLSKIDYKKVGNPYFKDNSTFFSLRHKYFRYDSTILKAYYSFNNMFYEDKILLEYYIGSNLEKFKDDSRLREYYKIKNK